MAPRRPVTGSVLAGLAIGSLVTLVILTVIPMVRLTQTMDQMALRSLDECHERDRNRIRCNPCA